MNTIKVTVTEVAKNFSDFVNRVAYRGEHFILLKGKREVAEMSPVPKGRVLVELPELLSKLPSLSRKEMEAFSEDLEKSRKQLANEKLRDPWVS
jgi:antitoxin (DNA-binding transcriptional repressor) of toxin-antitoxin stability system